MRYKEDAVLQMSNEAVLQYGDTLGVHCCYKLSIPKFCVDAVVYYEERGVGGKVGVGKAGIRGTQNV